MIFYSKCNKLSYKRIFKGIYIVSTSHIDPIDQFKKLELEQQSVISSKNRWLTNNMYKYYVLLHDAQDVEFNK
jgi:hypothetical protein